MSALFATVFSYNLSKWSIIRATTSVSEKDFVYVTQKIYIFYFTPSLLQNTHISLSILQDFSIKYSFYSIFLLFLSTASFYIRALSLFLPIFLICCSHSTPISLATAPPAITSGLPLPNHKPIHLPLPPPSQNLSHHQISTTHSP